MRFSGAFGDQEAEALVGAFACAFEARLLTGTGPARADASHARFTFAPTALTPTERELLSRAGDDWTQAASGLSEVRLPVARLEELAALGRCGRTLLATWRRGSAKPGAPTLMGILNVTPDSFSDGGAHADLAPALAQGRALFAAGAGLVDVGGESTRPGSEGVEAAIEAQRAVPVVAALAAEGLGPLSIDTTKASVARAALEAGASVINDVSAGMQDQEMLRLAAEKEAGLILMHRAGTSRDMQQAPHYDDVVREVAAHLRARARAAREAGVEPTRIVLDPGIGFGKRLEHNLALLRALGELRSLGFPLCLGVSRKSWLGALGASPVPAERRHETTAAVALAAFLGVELHRVHEIEPARAALSIARAWMDDRSDR